MISGNLWRARRALALVFVSALLALLPPGLAGAAEVTLRFLDVGQGDAALVSSQGHHALIDSGPHARMVDQLRALGVTSLDLLVSSHNHMDHFGGAEGVLRELPVARYLDNALPAKTRAQETILRLVEMRHVQHVVPTAGSVTVGEAVLRILPPAVDDGEQNDASVGLVLERGAFRALFPGDAEQPALSAWLAAALVPRVDVLKASHHGSRNGLTPLWLDRSRPRVVVISVGAGNDYGHPHAWALRYYEAGGRAVLRTDRDGEVRVSIADDGSYEVTTERGPRLPLLAAGGASDARSEKSAEASPGRGPDAQGAHAPAAGAPPVTAPPPGARTLAPASGSRVDRAREPVRGASCCRVCRSGKACGDGCVPREAVCAKAPGCACDG